MKKRRRKRRGLRALLAVAALALGAGVLLRPEARAPQADADDDALAAELRAHAPSRPLALLDLDRLDANLAAVRAQLKPPQRLRLVTKSLPSLELILYALERSGASGLMVFHAPFLPDLLRASAPDVDLLLGKPVSAAEAAELYDAIGADAAEAASRRIQWLVSDAAMLDDYLALAAARGLVLRINLEIDVGLHRGGARDAAELRSLLERLRRAADRARFSGFMGYDGHVAHAPGFGPFASREERVRSAFADMLARYEAFVSIARSEFPDLVPAEPTWNGAGSLTYTLYPPDAVVNDLALGGALLMPSTYDVFTLATHRPALFLAAPRAEAHRAGRGAAARSARSRLALVESEPCGRVLRQRRRLGGGSRASERARHQPPARGPGERESAADPLAPRRLAATDAASRRLPPLPPAPGRLARAVRDDLPRAQRPPRRHLAPLPAPPLELGPPAASSLGQPARAQCETRAPISAFTASPMPSTLRWNIGKMRSTSRTVW